MSDAASVPPASRAPRKRRTGWIVFLLLAGGALCVGVPLVFCGILSAGAPRIQSGSVLTLRFDGTIPDGPNQDPFANLAAAFEGGAPLSIHDLRTLVSAARDDDKIAGVLMEVGPLAERMGKLEEIREVLAGFKDKKPLYAFINADFVEEDAYFLASVADKVMVNPEAGFALNGFTGEALFLRGTLDKLHIKPDVIMFKEYKSAGEPYKNKEMSQYFEEVLKAVLDQYWSRVVEAAQARPGVDAKRVETLFAKGAFTAPEALRERLIDATGYWDELEAELRTKADPSAKEPRTVGGRRYLASKRGFGGKGEKIAVIYASGPITSQHGSQGVFGGEGIAGPDLAKTIREAADDERVKAIVMRVDSPGGSAIGSDYVRREMELAKAKKPVVVSMGGVAGSGGYWISMHATKIVAQPSTLTGSIGVVMAKFNLRGFYQEWIGANVDGIKVGSNAEMFSPTHNFTPEQYRVMTEWMQVVYDDFVKHVATGRGMTFEKAEPLAHGRVWTGVQAKDRGLVDELGGLDKAVSLAKDAAGIAGKDHQLVVFPKQKSFFEALAEGMEGARVAASPDAMQVVEQVRKDLETPKLMLLMPEIEVE